jgi:hypothetical protein
MVNGWKKNYYECRQYISLKIVVEVNGMKKNCVVKYRIVFILMCKR